MIFCIENYELKNIYTGARKLGLEFDIKEGEPIKNYLNSEEYKKIWRGNHAYWRQNTAEVE